MTPDGQSQHWVPGPCCSNVCFSVCMVSGLKATVKPRIHVLYICNDANPLLSRTSTKKDRIQNHHHSTHAQCNVHVHVT